MAVPVSDVTVYHDGVEIHNTPGNQSIGYDAAATTDHALELGRLIIGQDNNYLGCRVDDVIIFEKALSHDDIIKLSSMYP